MENDFWSMVMNLVDIPFPDVVPFSVPKIGGWTDYEFVYYEISLNLVRIFSSCRRSSASSCRLPARRGLQAWCVLNPPAVCVVRACVCDR